VATGPVVFDLQVLQSPDSRGSGIARHAYELALALEREHPGIVGRYLLNPDLPPPGDLGSLLGSGKIEYAGTSGAVPGQARVLHAPSPLELTIPIDRLWPGWAHKRGMRLCATVHNLIPLEHRHVCLDDFRRRSRYLARLEILRAADSLLTISSATTRSLASILGIKSSRIQLIGAGTAPRFKPAASKEEARAQAGVGVPGLEPSFVMCVVHSDAAESIEALVEALCLLADAPRKTRQLVLVGGLAGPTAERVQHVASAKGIGSRVLTPGSVSEETMLHLYQAAELVCFPSPFAGDSLAVNEAIACGAVAIASDAGHLRDFVAPEARFDPSDPATISSAIGRALSDGSVRNPAREHGPAASTTWTDVADRTVACYESLLARPRKPWRPRRRRVAFVSPFPPLASGIANYSSRLIEELAGLGELCIDCFADGLDRSPGPSRAPGGLPIYDARWLARIEAATAGYDEVVYVLGNSEFHAGALASLRRRRGIVMAHEVRLSGLYRFAADSTAAVPEGIAGSIRRIYGPLLPEELAASGEVTPAEAERYGLLMAREVMSLAERFLVTSEAAARLARIESGPALAPRVGVVPFATEILRTEGPSSPKAPPVAEEARVIASFGIVDPIKQPHRLIRSFAALARDNADLVLALVGPISIDLERELNGLGAQLGVAGRLFIPGRVEADDYLGWLGRAELAVQLRASFSGEASAAVGDCLAAGVPTIVTDIGWLGELPRGAVVKVPVDVTASELTECYRRLLGDVEERESLSVGARRYAEAHTFNQAARALREILDSASVAAG